MSLCEEWIASFYWEKKRSQELKYLSQKFLKFKIFCLLVLGTTVMIWSRTLSFFFGFLRSRDQKHFLAF